MVILRVGEKEIEEAFPKIAHIKVQIKKER